MIFLILLACIILELGTAIALLILATNSKYKVTRNND